jgi:hypothetical protein
MKRLRNLESLVKELSDQLEQAHAAAGGTSGPGSLPSEQHASSSTTAVHEDMGRLVLGDTDRPHYITSGFWSRISDEVRKSYSQSSNYYTSRTTHVNLTG